MKRSAGALGVEVLPELCRGRRRCVLLGSQRLLFAVQALLLLRCTVRVVQPLTQQERGYLAGVRARVGRWEHLQRIRCGVRAAMCPVVDVWVRHGGSFGDDFAIKAYFLLFT